MLFLEYPKCSTCKKAKKWLDEQGISYEDRHIIERQPHGQRVKRLARKKRIATEAIF